jgi:hypothetical protein
VRAIVPILLLTFLACGVIPVDADAASESPGPHSYASAEGYVPDAETAVKIAEAVWLPIYGERVLEKRPFKARLNGEIWTVEGSLPKGRLGGVPLAEIRKSDGAILRVSHGK